MIKKHEAGALLLITAAVDCISASRLTVLGMKSYMHADGKYPRS